MKGRIERGGPRDLPAATAAALFVGLMPAPDAVRRPEAWTDTIVRQLIGHRLAGHALAVLDESGTVLDEPTLSALEAELRVQTMLSMRLTRVVPELQQRLRRIGIDSLVVKGAGLSDLDPDGPTRFFGDVDILVPAADFPRAVAHYRDAGFVYEHPSPWSRIFGKSANLGDDEGRPIDLHRALAPWCWTTRLHFDDLWRRARTTADGVRTLSVEDALVVTALAQVADFGDPFEKLVPWRDLALLSRRVEPAQVMGIAGAAGVAGVVATVLAALPDDLVPTRLVGTLGGAHIPLTKAPRWWVLNQRTWAERHWAVRLTRSLPASRLIPGLVLLPVIPPDEQPRSEWIGRIGRGLTHRWNPSKNGSTRTP